METVRRIHFDESAQYKRIRIESLKDAPYAFNTKYQEAIRRSDKEWMEEANSYAVGNEKCAFFAFANRKIIGLCALSRQKDKSDEGELVQLWINPDFRGQKISRDLVDSALAWGKDNRITRIIANVKYYNERAIRFLEKCGFSGKAEENNDTIRMEAGN
jgi:RimJ/RimL family protein N-acetyltransferase